MSHLLHRGFLGTRNICMDWHTLYSSAPLICSHPSILSDRAYNGGCGGETSCDASLSDCYVHKYICGGCEGVTGTPWKPRKYHQIQLLQYPKLQTSFLKQRKGGGK